MNVYNYINVGMTHVKFFAIDDPQWTYVHRQKGYTDYTAVHTHTHNYGPEHDIIGSVRFSKNLI